MVGNNPGAAAHSKSDKCAGPLVGIVEICRNSRRVEKHKPEQEHDSEQKTGPLIKAANGNADSRSDESRTGQGGPEQTAWNPGRDQAGNHTHNKEMNAAENDQAQGEQVRT